MMLQNGESHFGLRSFVKSVRLMVYRLKVRLMSINARVKNRENLCLPHNRSLAALFFKDEGL